MKCLVARELSGFTSVQGRRASSAQQLTLGTVRSCCAAVSPALPLHAMRFSLIAAAPTASVLIRARVAPARLQSAACLLKPRHVVTLASTTRRGDDFVAPPVEPRSDATAPWADDEECLAVFEVEAAALRSLCHGGAHPPPCSHEYWRARGWRARPREWERYVHTLLENRESWPAECVADDAGDVGAYAADAERARAKYASALASAEAAAEGVHVDGRRDAR